MSSSTTESDEVSFFIRASPETGIDSFLSDRGIPARRTHGPRNSIGDIAKTLAERPEPYVFITASALAIRAAFRAYADTHKKRIIVRDERGNEIDATNYTVEDLKKLNPINAFEVADDNNSMGDISFELWSDDAEFPELLPFLRNEGLTVAEPSRLQARSLDGAQVTTIVVAISGVAVAVARAFQAYFKRTGKAFTASNLHGKIHAENFTEEEIRKLIAAADLLLLAEPKPKKREPK